MGPLSHLEDFEVSSDQTEAITESTKAVQELAKAGGKGIDASRGVGGWLNRIFGEGIEDAVALHWSDRIKARRIERAIYDWVRLNELLTSRQLRQQMCCTFPRCLVS